MQDLIRGINVYMAELNMFLATQSFKPPKLAREMSDHYLGYFKLSLPDEVSPLEAEQTLNGIPAAVRSRFGRDPGDWTSLAYYEKLLDVTGTHTPATRGRVIMMRGLLNEVDPPAVQGVKPKDDATLRWSSIVFYHDIMDGKTVHKFNPFKNELIIDGVNYSSETNRLLAI